jgi:hypothetical protein
MSVQLNSTLGRAFTWVGKVRPAVQQHLRHGLRATAFRTAAYPIRHGTLCGMGSSRHGIPVDQRPHTRRCHAGRDIVPCRMGCRAGLDVFRRPT